MNKSALPGGPYTIHQLEATFPWIHWREPQHISVMGSGEEGYACRVCVANHGIQVRDVADLPKDPADVVEHISTEHLHEHAVS